MGNPELLHDFSHCSKVFKRKMYSILYLKCLNEPSNSSMGNSPPSCTRAPQATSNIPLGLFPWENTNTKTPFAPYRLNNCGLPFLSLLAPWATDLQHTRETQNQSQRGHHPHQHHCSEQDLEILDQLLPQKDAGAHVEEKQAPPHPVQSTCSASE